MVRCGEHAKGIWIAVVVVMWMLWLVPQSCPFWRSCSVVHVQVLPLEALLRSSWNSNCFLKSTAHSDKPFLIEDGSKAHITRLNELMTSDYHWSCVALVSFVSSEADLIGKWSESCGCPHHQVLPRVMRKRSGQQLRVGGKDSESLSCPFRCCRAPELAIGAAMDLQRNVMLTHKEEFLEYIAVCPTEKQTELAGTWTKACGKLYGAMFAIWR